MNDANLPRAKWQVRCLSQDHVDQTSVKLSTDLKEFWKEDEKLWWASSWTRGLLLCAKSLWSHLLLLNISSLSNWCLMSSF